MGDGKAWPRDAWKNAMWNNEDLKPNERVVAAVFYEYAGSGDISWSSWEELMRRTGIRARDTVNNAVKGLVTKGWLKEVEKARQHRSTRYQLCIPTASSSAPEAVDNSAEESSKRTAETSSSPENGPLEGGSKITPGAPSSPDSRPSSPDSRFSSPDFGPDSSHGSIALISQRPGDAPSPDPWRPNNPPTSGCWNELPTSPSVGGYHAPSVDQVTHPHASARDPGQIHIWLPDGVTDLAARRAAKSAGVRSSPHERLAPVVELRQSPA